MSTNGGDSSKQLSREEEEERMHFQKVTNAFRSYKKYSMAAIHKREEYLSKLPVEHQKLLRKHGYQDVLDDLKQAVEQNNDIIVHILKDVEGVFENVSYASKADVDPRMRPGSVDMDKVQSTVKQIVRDWSSVGKEEREKCYRPLLNTLLAIYPANRNNIKVLVPGAGLGRLAFDIAMEGFECQGNEFSLYMLFASNFILNKCQAVNCFKIRPYIHQFCNNLSSKDQLREVSFPDLDPNTLPEDAKFSMAAGDFVEVYAAPEYISSQDCVVTCFFLDCAHNIIQFAQTIHRILKQGGTWLNVGPLLYHFSDMKGEDSIEPDYQILRAIILDLGFEFESEENNVPCTYSQNESSMLHYSYNCVRFTARKK